MADLISQFAQQKRDGEDVNERDKDEHYATPYPAASIMSEILYRYWYSTRPHDEEIGLVDVGADEGQWGTAFSEVIDDLSDRGITKWTSHRLAGIEKRITGRYKDPDNYEVIYDDWIVADATDMSNYPDDTRYRIAFGNPPYLTSKKQGELMTKFLKDLTEKFEVCAFLLQTNYLASEQRYEALFKSGLALVAQSYSRIHFEGRGKQQYREYAFYIWDQRYPVDQMPELTWFDANKQFIDPRFLAKYRS